MTSPGRQDHDVSSPGFLSGGGTVGHLIRAHDWSATSSGPQESWPQPLKTLVEIMLGSSQPMFIAWGPDLADFTLVADARFTGNPFRNTVYVMFRVKVRHSPNGIDGFDGIRLVLLLDERQLSVRRFAEEGREYLLSPDPLPVFGEG